MLLSADMLWAGEWGLCSRWKKKKSKHKSKSWNLVLHLLCNRCCLGAILGSFKPMLKVKGALKKKKKACIYAWCLLSVSKPWGEEFHHLLAENLKPTNPSPAEIKPLWTVNYQSLCFALKFSFPLEKDLFKNPLVSRTLGRSRRRRKGVRVRAVPQRVTCWGEVCGRWRDVSYSPAAGQHHLLSYDICLPADGRGLCSEGDKHGLLLRKKKKKEKCPCTWPALQWCLAVWFQLMLWCIFSEQLWHCEWGTVTDLNFGGENRQFHQVPREIDDRLANAVTSRELHSSLSPELLVWFPAIFPLQL